MAQPSMFTRWLRTTLGLLLLMGAGAVALFVLHPRGADVEALLRELPSDTGSLVIAKDLDKLLGALNAIAAQPTAPPELLKFQRDLRAQSTAQLGFDATQPEQWRKAGVDLGGAWALTSSGHPNDPFAFSWIPISDAKEAQATLEKNFRAMGAELEPHNADGLTVTRVRWPASTARTSGTPGAYAARGDYLVIAGSLAAGDAEAALRKQLAGHGLDQSPALRKVRDAIGEPWTVFAYTAPDVVEEQLRANQASAAAPFAQQGFGGSLLIADDRIALRARLLGDPTQMAPIFAAAHPPQDRVAGVPFGAARASLDLKALVAALQKTPDGQKQLEDLKQAVAPMDLQRDVVEGFDGQLSLAVLEPELGSASPADVVFALGAKDPKHAVGLLQPQLLKFGFLPGDDGWLRGPGMAVGPGQDAVVLVAGADARVEKAKQTVAKGGASFAASLPGPARDGFQKGPALWAYLDLERIAEALANKPGLPGGFADARILRGLQSASAGLEVRDGVTRFDLDLYPPPGGFSRAIAGGAKDAGT